jgi:hypothetical protein
MTNEWSDFYGYIFTEMKIYGINDAFGSGDFWVHDDDWGGKFVKIIIFKIEILYIINFERIRMEIHDKFPKFTAIFALDLIKEDVLPDADKTEGRIYVDKNGIQFEGYFCDNPPVCIR